MLCPMPELWLTHLICPSLWGIFSQVFILEGFKLLVLYKLCRCSFQIAYLGEFQNQKCRDVAPACRHLLVGHRLAS